MNFSLSHTIALLCVALIFHTNSGRAMNFDSLDGDGSQNPSSLQWRVIETSHFRIIFPKKMQNKALELGNALEDLRPILGNDLKSYPEKLPLVIQNQSIFSNGLVALAPWHSQFFMTPPLGQSFGAIDWANLLSLHEYRHAVQIFKNKAGFNRVYQVLFGETGLAVGTLFSTPSWYLEGDAVHAETVFSSGGRGRQPRFLQHYKAMALADEYPSFDEVWLGSYKKFYPNQYPLGYLVTTHLRRQLGRRVFHQIQKIAAAKSFVPYGMEIAIKKQTGVSLESHYQKMLKKIQSTWKKNTQPVFDTAQTLPAAKIVEEDFFQYFSPAPLKDGSLFALKTGLGILPSFVKVFKGGEQEILLQPSIVIDCPLIVRNQKVAFAERDKHPRWGVQTFANIAIFDTNTSRKKTLTSKGRYFCPRLSPAGKKVAAIHISPNLAQRIVILSSKTGKILKSIRMNSKKMILFASWHPSGNSLLLTYQTPSNQRGISLLKLKGLNLRNLWGPVSRTIAYAQTDGKKIIFEDPYSGTDNIYQLYPNGKAFAITDSHLGAHAPNLYNKRIYYSEYSLRGLRPYFVSKRAKRANLKKNESALNYSRPLIDKTPLYRDLYSQQRKQQLAKGNQYFKAEKYSILGDFFNLHSWIFYAPPLSPDVGVLGLSNNYLNTVALQAGLNFNLNESTSQVLARVEVSALYPIFFVAASYGDRSLVVERDSAQYLDQWKETTLQLGLTVPLSWPNNSYTNRLRFGVSGDFISATNRRFPEPHELDNAKLFGPTLQASYSRKKRKAHRDLFSPWGLALGATFRTASDLNEQFSETPFQSYQGLQLFAPGPLPHQSFWMKSEFESQAENSYQYSELLLFPRGYDSIFSPQKFKTSLNSSLPLFYPDFALGRYYYLKRIWTTTFYDHLRAQFSGIENDVRSIGQEIVMEGNFFRLPFALEIGLRASYRVELEDWDYGIFLTQSLFSF